MSKQVDNAPLVKLCGLWANVSRSGKTYFTGKLNRNVRVVIFENNNRQSDKDPTHTLHIRQDMPQEDRSE